MDNDLLEDIKKETPAKFKINYVGVYFVSSLICIVWKITDLIIYLIDKI